MYNELDNEDYLFEDINIAQHTYNSSGTYFATVRVTDRFGATDTANIEVSVDE